MKLLCVDDNATQRTMIDLMLATTGIDVDFAGDGPAAIAACQSQAYDAVLMDIDMPEMCGLQAARAIRRREAGLQLEPTPILFMTGNRADDHLQDAASAGGNGHVFKPFTAEGLIRALDHLLGMQGALKTVHRTL